MSGGLDVADVDDTSERSGPEARDRSAAGVESKVVTGALVVPARRHDPCVLVLEVALLGFREGALVPGMALVDRIAERISLDEGLGVLPVIVVGAAEQNADVEVDIDKVICYKLAVDDNARRDVHGLAPLVHVFVGVVADVGIVE